NLDDNTVSVIDVATDSVIGAFSVGQVPQEVVLDPRGVRAYVANDCGDGVCQVANGTISVVDTVAMSVLATIPVGPFPWGIAVHPNGQRVYVVNECGTVPCDAGYQGGSVSVIDSTLNQVVDNIPLFDLPDQAAIDPSGQRLYVGLF